ncbi:MAG: Sapep family Mn(2+)-dependent dipeptidase [Clostridia bacterium]|nr:Sapep family Mn(2+)-dependent dipeptidase [Clostridia bacterium]
MNQAIEKFIDDTMDRQIADLQSLIRIPSVSRGEPKPGMPYGENVYNALMRAEQIARELGFEKVFDVEKRCGVIEYGEGDELVAVMAHLDVVPEGTGWRYPPYGAEIHDGAMYGRGTADDKGAAVSALYALAAIKQSGLKMKRRVRILLGCDEERGSTGMMRYKEVEGEPDLAFTPDASYPLVNSEMNIMHITYKKQYPCAVSARVGTAGNVIPAQAQATAAGQVFEAIGKEGHASQPEHADNALLKLIGLLSQAYLPAEDGKTFQGLAQKLCGTCHGEGLGVDLSDASGRLTLAPTLLNAGKEGVDLTFDIRYPASFSCEELLLRLTAAMGEIGFAEKEHSDSRGHYIAPETELVSTLMSVYGALSGDTAAAPISIGGGTYAREFANAVATGVTRPDRPDLCHVANENILLSEIAFNTRFMAESLRRLAAE